jgi:hypothetical protein
MTQSTINLICMTRLLTNMRLSFLMLILSGQTLTVIYVGDAIIFQVSTGED